ncbi:glycosyltransferase family 2 protein [uncultured Pontibacter sp.]|uniref:glycosyltransferase family 2 protein n=1 Tax=uncultured Pontibacter sp. TaxID=453356 RepID=UPI00262939EB|nr:glycosyltransferase family 2 protein [uncultured Pontibacter sp.]
MSERVAGVVVLYRPDEEVVENINTYITSVQKLYLVDNTETSNHTIVQALQSASERVEYIHLLENRGIAKALNEAATRALQEGYDWLLTMDQDSRASQGMLSDLLAVGDTYASEELGIIAPRYIQQTDETVIPRHGIEEVDVVITSGNLLNLKAYAEVGPFREDFFIDYVDHEYCLRLKLAGYKIIVNNKVLLSHKLGNSQNHRLIGRPVVSSHHNSLRRYYITRNRLAVLKEFGPHFPDYYKEQHWLNVKELIKVLLYEDDKLSKIKSVFRGYWDFKKGNFGKYRHD